MGRLDEALDEMLVAQSLDPVSAIVARDVAAVHFYRRDFQTALERCDHTIELNPHFGAAYWMLGLVQEQLKDFDESEAAFQRAVHLSPNMPRVHGALGPDVRAVGPQEAGAGGARQARRVRESSATSRRWSSPGSISRSIRRIRDSGG